VEIIVSLLSLVFTLVIMLVSLLATALAFLVPVVITGVLIYVMMKNGGTVTVSGPLAQAMAQSAGGLRGPAPPKLNLVKVGTCKACGAHRTTPSASAYVHCDHCGQLTDWDFKAAMADTRSRAPGPQYEALLKRANKGLQAAREAGDRARYVEIQEELWQTYARLCPAACPPRIGDEAYRKRWVAWSARAQAEQDLDEGCAETFTAQQQATAALKWDRSNPMQPKVELDSYRALLDAVLAHQKQVGDHLEHTGLLAEHPDRPDPAVFKAIGTAAFVQGWLSYLPKSEHDATLEKTGLAGEYIEPPAVDLTEGTCPSCSAPLEVPADAKRVVCVHCGHGVSVQGGELPCLGCGSTIEIPREGDAYSCPYCELRVERIGLG